MNLSKYRKGIIAFGGFLVVLGGVLSDGSISAEELGAVVTAGAVALGVYRIPNAPKE